MLQTAVEKQQRLPGSVPGKGASLRREACGQRGQRSDGPHGGSIPQARGRERQTAAEAPARAISGVWHSGQYPLPMHAQSSPLL